MHQGSVDTHKDPGKEVWVYDLSRKERVQKIELKNLAGSIQVTSDEKPLLFTIFIESSTTDVYDAVGGATCVRLSMWAPRRQSWCVPEI
jgi:methylamine dehydrogenase heavy chain